MNLNDLLELSEKLEERINAYWNFYTIVILAIAGWLYSTDITFGVVIMIVLTIALVAFLFSNLAVITFATRKLTALKSEIEAIAPSSGLKSEKSVKQLGSWSIPNRLKLSWALHLLLDIALVTAIWVNG